MRICSIPECGRNLYAAGKCRTHYLYSQKKRGANKRLGPGRKTANTGRTCLLGCEMEATRAGLCVTHYMRKVIEKRPDWDKAKRYHRPRAKRVFMKLNLLLLRPDVLEALQSEATRLSLSLETVVSAILESWGATLTPAKAETPPPVAARRRHQRSQALPGMTRVQPRSSFYLKPDVRDTMRRRSAAAELTVGTLVSAILNESARAFLPLGSGG